MRAGVAQGGLFPLSSLVLRQRHALTLAPFELALYAEDTAIIATSCKPTALVSYLESKRKIFIGG